MSSAIYRKRAIRRLGPFTVALAVLWVVISCWYAHHPKAWRDAKRGELPAALANALEWTGLPAADLTDAFGWTGEDATFSTSVAPPSGRLAFAGLPVRRRAPAPNDIRILERGDFAVGWSPQLRHPLWCAYHVTRKALFEPPERPPFKKDRDAANCPAPSMYTRSGYDRGHMAPNYAIATRFGPLAQEKTFLMSNIAPQSPTLNRGVWRDIEHRIAEFWTARWGEIWVIAGAVPGGMEKISGTGIDVPPAFYQIVIAQDGGEIRVLAVLFDQDIEWRAWPTDYITSIDEIEALTGLDFFTELDDALEEKLEAAKPTRLWPVKFFDAFRQLLNHNS